MIKLKHLNIKIPKNYVLIEVIDDTDYATIGDLNIQIGKTYLGDKYNEGLYSVRRGYLIAMPNKIDYSEAGTPWINDVRPDIGDVVYFEYLTGKTSTHCEYGGNIYYILPYRSLVLSLNAEMDTNTIQMLNGFIMAKNMLKQRSSELEIKDTYYDDRYEILRIGEPNRDYLDGLIDDDSIKVGDKVITRFKHYQELEPKYQCRLDGNYYIYFQRKEIIGIL